MLRLGSVLSVFAIGSLLLIAVQWTLEALGLRPQPKVSTFFYRILRRLLRLRVHVIGAPVKGQSTLLVSNHVSWVDIAAIGSIMPLHFVAKREVRDWPLVGLVAELTGTIFVDRNRRQKTGNVNTQIAQRLANGHCVVLFAEGTSSDGNHVLPFRSALVGAVTTSLAEPGVTAGAQLQPLSICYTHLDGMPLGRAHRPLIAWYGDMDFVPHLRKFVELGAIDVAVTFGEPLAAASIDRKEAVKSLEGTVRGLTSRALRGQPAPEPP